MMQTAEVVHEVTIEAFAQWLAHFVYFAPRSAEAVERLGVSDSFARARAHWEEAMRADARDERHDRISAFGKRFAEVRGDLRARKPPIEALGILDAERAPSAPAPAPAVARSIAVATPAAQVEPPVDAPAPRAAFAAPPPIAHVEREPPPPPIAPPAPVHLPAPPLATSFDPDETLPVPAAFVLKAAVPFAGSTSPEQVADMFDPVEPRTRSAEIDPDETAMMPVAAVVAPKTGTFRDQLGPLVVPLLSLDEYADLRARLTVFGEAHAPTLAHYAVAAREVREAVQARFADYFQRNTAAQAQFLAAMQAAILRVRKERDGGDP